jgi:transketolase
VLRESGGGPNGLEGRGPDGNEELIVIATGSELQLAMGAAEAMEREGHPTRVVSLPCWELFELQDQAYRDSVLPPSVRARLAIESGASLGWERWVGTDGAIIGLDHFGASAPAPVIFEKFGFTVDRVTDAARGVLEGRLRGPIPTLEPGHLPAAGAAHGADPARDAGPR